MSATGSTLASINGHHRRGRGGGGECARRVGRRAPGRARARVWRRRGGRVSGREEYGSAAARAGRRVERAPAEAVAEAVAATHPPSRAVCLESRRRAHRGGTARWGGERRQRPGRGGRCPPLALPTAGQAGRPPLLAAQTTRTVVGYQRGRWAQWRHGDGRREHEGRRERRRAHLLLCAPPRPGRSDRRYERSRGTHLGTATASAYLLRVPLRPFGAASAAAGAGGAVPARSAHGRGRRPTPRTASPAAATSC